MQNNTLLITGAAGFVGGQTLIEARDAGYHTIAVDHRPFPDHLKGLADIEIVDDYVSDQCVSAILENPISAVVHCGGTSLVGPSVANPAAYYENNFVKTKYLVEHIIQAKKSVRFIFSSSSSVYGEPVMIPCREEDPPLPLSPYGESKYMSEMMLNSYAQAYGLDVVMLRYFNVCGADPLTRHGQEPNATHILARVLESIRDGKKFTLFGNDYPTADGTCVRDQVHVQDLAKLHIMAVSRDFAGGIYNVASTGGSSNREIIRLAEEVTGKKLDMEECPRRPGDPSQLIGSTDRVQAQGWIPQHSLRNMVEHAWSWYTR